ncbi:MAG: pantoate--beta-alanine ligase [Chloroflexota bacterium]
MTRVVRGRAELRAALAALPRPIGLVPTMGALHDGHRALIRASRAADAATVVSVFVNPRQFGESADLAGYPRDEAADVALCAAEGVALVWAPAVTDAYPPGFQTTVGIGSLAQPLEGAARPGHFDGVATVVAILLALVGPERAYFGRKDAQQLAVVTRMATDLGLPTRIVGCPTVREPDGLARSSRNVRLTPADRLAAPVVHRALAAALAHHAAGERSAAALRSVMDAVLAAEPRAQREYVSVADPATLAELDAVGPEGALLSLAVRFGAVRLIDNETIPPAAA